MDSMKQALLCQQLADDKKAENIVVLDMTGVSSITDYFVLASGSSAPHMRAIAEEIEHKLKKDHQITPRAVEGTMDASWIVMDYFDVIVHVMRNDLRDRYDLDGLWGDAPRVKPARQRTAAAPEAKSTAPAKLKVAAKVKPKAPAKRKPKVAARAKAKPKSKARR